MNLTLPRELEIDMDLGLSLGLAMLIALTLVGVFSQWRADFALSHQPIGTVMPATNASDTAIATLPKAHLFGQSLLADGELPVTNLQLRVTSIIKAINTAGNDVSRAIIAISGDAGKVYQVGDALPDGVKIYQINANEVVIENDGRLEKLPLPRNQLVFKAPMTEESFS